MSLFAANVARRNNLHRIGPAPRLSGSGCQVVRDLAWFLWSFLAPCMKAYGPSRGEGSVLSWGMTIEHNHPTVSLTLGGVMMVTSSKEIGADIEAAAIERFGAGLGGDLL